MTNARWPRIEELYHAALAREEPQRAAYLRDACGGDEELRREVESLLACDGTADGFLRVPSRASAATFVSTDPSRSLIGNQIGAYRVVSLLGAGAMGEVYRAHDATLGRDVAIKVLPQRFTADADRLARFKREARVLATLNHPNVGAIYGFEEVAPSTGSGQGVQALVLELVEGHTLAEMLAPDSSSTPRARLSVKQALDIARQIADALDAAHAKGIVHRDLKPANIKITPDGRVKVLDFGLAKTAATDGTTSGNSTHEGMILGTPAYMSPEQARGKPVDKRADIWAFGSVLYEMLTGRPPFAGETVSDAIAAVLGEEPDWSALPNSAPAGIRRLLHRCLEKDPKDRLRDIGDARTELEDTPSGSPRASSSTTPTRPGVLLAWGVGLLLVVAGSVAGWRLVRGTERPPSIDSLAVLPFRNLTGDQDMEYFSEGLTEELINALSNIPPLRVVSRTTVFQFKNYAGDIRELGRRLNVDAILEGTVRRQDDRIKVIAQLNSVQDGYNYWSKTWDNKIGDFFEIQEEIAKQLARSLRPSEAGVVNAGRPLTTDPEAYTLYIKGQFHRRRSSETEVKTAVGFYQQAIARDPRFAEAYVGLAIVLSEAGTSGLLSPSEAVPEAKAAVAKALELNPLLASAYAAQGSIALHYDWDWAAARQNLERAIELDPTDAETHHSYSHFLLVMGRFPESLAESLRAIELDPLNAGMHGHLVLHYACAREFPMAIEAAKTAIGIDPASKQTWRFKLSVHEFLGEFENAIDARSGMGEPRELTETLRTGLTTAGPLGYWAAVRDSELKKTDAQVDALMLAHAYARLGQSREAMDWLERMFRDRIGSLVYLNINIDFDSIRNDPRFKDLIKRIGLPAPR